MHYRLPAASVAAGRYIGRGVYVVDLSGPQRLPAQPAAVQVTDEYRKSL